ncbi:MAG: hypothetical protein A2826_00895 [Candidatus Doudnabacteria bacterium RIFCSPHIGHO2_01_FULL_43_23]|uniref:Uncharacterized protein n=1 Tax=Candidatus Doudnabacteria bacterium RIFCSPHIGHO2_01_FULL_43_23 TaxID=1817822 RepID=A0A1F5NR67_9BACT|nr:MAG: hypothetical protein A2826_00895 [Candidatus Doudnabacteria bacterium RIFCSPHIGHO2_01_FULL_43_23]
MITNWESYKQALQLGHWRKAKEYVESKREGARNAKDADQKRHVDHLQRLLFIHLYSRGLWDEAYKVAASSAERQSEGGRYTRLAQVMEIWGEKDHQVYKLLYGQSW